MNKKLFRTPIIAIALFFSVVSGPAFADCPPSEQCVVVRANSAAALQAIASAHGLTIVEDADPSQPSVVLARAAAGAIIENVVAGLEADALVLGAEQAGLASLSEDDSSAVLDSVPLAALDQSFTGIVEDQDFTTDPWSGYFDQAATSLVRVPETHSLSPVEARGIGIVAVIDTGVDPDHPLLDGALVTGYDFIKDELGIPSEWDALDPATSATTKQNLEAAADQSFTGIVEGNGVTVAKGPGTEVIVDQSFTGIVEGESLPAGFGHGTMVAGIVRMIAPGAKIMPLRAFDGDGKGSLWNIIRAIYFATAAGADVINMSFSLDSHSEELERAINFAKLFGVVCVSSTGNQGTANFTYPAALGNVIGVASTDNNDNLSAFSNYGMGLATLAAPGEGIVTLYPGGHYVGAWGTSFSSAFVAGAVALLHEYKTIFGYTFVLRIPYSLAEYALESSAYNPDPVNLIDWGAGRLDVRDAFDYGLVGN